LYVTAPDTVLDGVPEAQREELEDVFAHFRASDQ
jgi:hypothetical protein